jgi:hypothetical protein
MPTRSSDKNTSSVKYKAMVSARKAIRIGLLEWAAAVINWAAVLFGKNFDTYTGSDARENMRSNVEFGTI